MKRRVEALKWVVRADSCDSIEWVPAFEQWLAADRRNWTAYVRALRAYSSCRRLARELSQNPAAVQAKLVALKRKRIAACRTHRELWIALGISLALLLLT